MRNIYLQLEQLPTPAYEGNYMRYSMRTHISPVEAAHLLSGIVPEADTEFAFLNPSLSEVRELHDVLIEAARANKIENLILEMGRHKASLLNWTRYLICVGYPIPDILWHIFDHKLLSENPHPNQPEKSSTEQKFSFDTTNRDRLEKKIVEVASLFPNIPRKYFRLHPDISPLVQPNIQDSTFEDLVTNILKDHNFNPRQKKRPKMNFWKEYEITHPQLNKWFSDIQNKQVELKSNKY